MNQQLHIVHIVYRFAVGGLENGIINLINHLPQGKYRHTIICLSGFDPDFAARLTQPVHIESIDKKPGPDWRYYFKVWQRLMALKPDILHTRNLTSMEYQLPGLLAGVNLRVHGEHGWDMGDLNGKSRKHILLKKLLRPLVHQFVALSKQSTDYLREEVGVSEQRCHQIINGVDTERFSPDGASPDGPHPYFFTDDSFVFGSVGRLATVKNHQLLASAFIRICKERQNDRSRLRLVLVGDGEQYENLQNQFRSAGIEEQVWMAGNQADIPCFLRCMDVFVLPSLAEGISNTILEALASGLPVIATEVGGNSELVCPGVSGYLTPTQNVEAMAAAMASYLDQPDQLFSQAIAARASAKANFSLSAMIQHYDNVYSYHSFSKS